MKRLDKVPSQLATRAHPGSIPVQCECSIVFAHEIDRGNPVTCPSCGAFGDVDLTPDPQIRAALLAAQKM
jgi:hypothetical protein